MTSSLSTLTDSPTAPLEVAESLRRTTVAQLDSSHRAHLGQFMTPAPVAEFMAGMFQLQRKSVRILDPGAGVGNLTAAVVHKLTAASRTIQRIEAVCYEVDERLADALEQTLAACADQCLAPGIAFHSQVRRTDYITARAEASRELFCAEEDELFDIVVMNPPYRKINSHSETRQQLRVAGIETSNLYAGFMLLGARQLRDGGEFVSISPRSFCNGPYFRPFRQQLLQLLDIRRLHVFESRRDAFKDDAVLQENVILSAVRRDDQSDQVTVSCSGCDGHLSKRDVPAEHVLWSGDPESIIHIPTPDDSADVALAMRRLPATLHGLGIQVSTGRIVDFRAKEHLRDDAEPRSVPLIYPAHFHMAQVHWPNGNTRKANAIMANKQTASLLVPTGFYVLTKRFTAKEEPRRVVAVLFDPDQVSAKAVGFDNKTNYYHVNGGGLDKDIARGLTVFLNSSMVDEFFRQFSGHTQVNATDLRRLRYPNREQLRCLASRVRALGNQDQIDAAVEELLQSLVV